MLGEENNQLSILFLRARVFSENEELILEFGSLRLLVL